MQFISPDIEQYAISKSTRPSSIAAELEIFTQQNMALSQMLIGQMEASLLGFLLRLIRAKRVLEIGTFTGYSALIMAENLSPTGEVHTIDINEEYVRAGEPIWRKSEHAGKIQVHVGNALDVIPGLSGKFDLVFIDADKENYLNYLQLVSERLSNRGIIVIDNVLWSGRVLDDSDQDEQTQGIRHINDYLESSDLLYSTLLPIRDGVFLVQKKESE